MKIHEIKIYQEFDAPVEVVWDALSDHKNFGKLMGIPVERIIDSPEPNNPNGAGSVRRINIPLFGFEETILKADKPNYIEYKISKGTPLNHHLGKMVFKALPGQRSAIDYTITLGSKVPLLGAIVKNGLGNGINKSLKSYARRLQK